MTQSRILIHILNIQDWQPLSRSQKVTPFIENLSSEELDKLMDDFALYVLRLFQSLVMHSIKVQQFRSPSGTHGGMFLSLSPKWKKKKKKLKLKSGFWEATGKIQKTITYWKKADGSYIIGFRPQSRHPLTGQRVDIIAATLETGSKKRNIPPRPLFRPIAVAINKDIFNHFERFIRDTHPEYLDFLS